MSHPCVVLTAHKRSSVTRRVLDHWHDHQANQDRPFRLVVAATREQDVDLARDYTEHAYGVPNRPLSTKHNFAVQLAQAFEPDRVMVANSDDLFTPALVERLLFEPMGHDVRRVRSCNYVRYMDTSLVAHVPEALPGSGVTFTRDALNRLCWRPWQGSPKNRWLDTMMFDTIMARGLSVNGVMPSVESPMQMLSLKTDENLWGFREHLALFDYWAEAPGDFLAKRFPALTLTAA